VRIRESIIVHGFSIDSLTAPSNSSRVNGFGKTLQT
jgi:hypothetical protein